MLLDSARIFCDESIGVETPLKRFRLKRRNDLHLQLRVSSKLTYPSCKYAKRTLIIDQLCALAGLQTALNLELFFSYTGCQPQLKSPVCRAT